MSSKSSLIMLYIKKYAFCTLLMLFSITLSGIVQAQISIKSTQQISEGVGGFNVDLESIDAFGAAIVDLGDLDGDGVIDLAVGNNYRGTGCNECTGEVYILFMNADGSVKSHQVIREGEGGFTGELGSFNRFGTSLANIGDFNKDGVTDLAVGSDGLFPGFIWLLFLDENGMVKSHQKIGENEGGFTGEILGQTFGSSIINLGDLDGNSVIDLAVGMLRDSDGGVGAGAMWVLYMNEDGTVKDQKKLGGNTPGLFQEHVLDFEGLTAGMVIYEASADTDFGPVRIQGFQGSCDQQAAVIFESSNPTRGNYDLGTPHESFGGPGIGAGGKIGSRYANDTALGNMLILHGRCHDLNNDYVDSPNDAESQGKVILSFPETVTFTDLTAVDIDREDELVVTVLKNVYDDSLIVQAPITKGNGKAIVSTDEGEDKEGVTLTSRVILEREGSIGLDNFTFRTGLMNGSFGRSSAMIGDLDGDGIDEWAVGELGEAATGAVWILFLNADQTIKHVQRITMNEGGFDGLLEERDQFGASVSSLGDIDEDGIPDIAVGAIGDDDDEEGNGALWILLLKEDGTSKKAIKITGIDIGAVDDFAELGSSVQRISDLDGNGVRDLAVGAFNYEFAGAIWIVFLEEDLSAVSGEAQQQHRAMLAKDEDIAHSFALHQAYPNPFNPSTQVQFTLPHEAPVRLFVYDSLGREVRRLVDNVLSEGHHEVVFDASQLPGGMYLLRLETPVRSMTQKVILLK